MMVENNTSAYGTGFTVTIRSGRRCDHRRLRCRPRDHRPRGHRRRRKPSDLNRPGHVFPLRAQPGGDLTRGGHTEATIDLVTWLALNRQACCAS